MEMEMEMGLTGLATEMVHKVALSGWLGVGDVAALSQTCRRMADVLVWDEYGRDLHFALLGVVENVVEERWKAAKYAMGRRWYGGGEGLWRTLVTAAYEEEAFCPKAEGGGKTARSQVCPWEEVVVAALDLDQAEGMDETWVCMGGEVSLFAVGAFLNSLSVVEWCVEAGMDVWKETELGCPMTVACGSADASVLDAIINAGGDINGRESGQEGGGGMPMVVAVMYGNVEAVRYLLQAGVDASVLVDGGNALHTAIVYGRDEIVRVLVEEGGVDVESWSSSGLSPLTLAVVYTRVNVVEALLECGAQVGREDGTGVTPLGLARKRDEGKVLDVLEAWGKSG